MDELSDVMNAVFVVIYSILDVWEAVWDVLDGLTSNICSSREDLRVDGWVDWLREGYFDQDVSVSGFKDFVFVDLAFLAFSFVLARCDFCCRVCWFRASVHKNSLKRFGTPWIHEWREIKPCLSFDWL